MQKNTVHQTLLLVLLLFSQACLAQINKGPNHTPTNNDISILNPDVDNFVNDEIHDQESASHEAYSGINNSSIEEEMD